MKPRTNFLLGSRIFSPQVAVLLALLLEVTLVWAADKPWKTKPFQQWDQKELQSILTDSPWVRVTTIQRTWLPVSEKDVAPDPQINGGVRQMPAGGGEAVGFQNHRRLRELPHHCPEPPARPRYPVANPLSKPDFRPRKPFPGL